MDVSVRLTQPEAIKLLVFLHGTQNNPSWKMYDDLFMPIAAQIQDQVPWELYQSVTRGALAK